MNIARILILAAIAATSAAIAYGSLQRSATVTPTIPQQSTVQESAQNSVPATPEQTGPVQASPQQNAPDQNWNGPSQGSFQNDPGFRDDGNRDRDWDGPSDGRPNDGRWNRDDRHWNDQGNTPQTQGDDHDDTI